MSNEWIPLSSRQLCDAEDSLSLSTSDWGDNYKLMMMMIIMIMMMMTMVIIMTMMMMIIIIIIMVTVRVLASFHRALQTEGRF